MPWTPPNPYKPRPDIVTFLRQANPQVDTALFKMVDYVQRRSWPLNKSIDEAWQGIQPVTPAKARTAIEEKIVPEEIYDRMLALALQDNN